MGVIQCRFVCRCSPHRRSISPPFIYCSFQPSYVPYGVQFHNRDPRRYSATCGLKTQRSSTSRRCCSAFLNHSGRARISQTTSSGECCCVPFSGAFAVLPPSRATESVPPINRIEKNTMSNGEQESWSRVKERLRADVGEDVYSSWFARMDLEAIEEGSVRLSVPTRFLKSWIQSHYAERVLACWQAQEGKVTRVELVVRSAVLKSAMLPKAKPDIGLGDMGMRYTNGNGRPLSVGDPSVHEALGGSPLDPRLTFDTFVVGRSNTLAHAAAKQVAGAKRGEAVMFNPLYIHSGVGLGKTHLLQAVTWAGNAAGERKVLYLTAEKFMYGFVSALRTQTALAFKEALRGIGVLVIDDLQFLQGKSTQAEFCHTLNALIDAGRQVVIASDRPPSDLESLDDRVRSRLAGGLVVEMGALGEELRFEILKVRVMAARQYHPSFDVPLPVLAYIAKTVTHNGRDLEGALNRLLAHNKLTGHAVTLEMAEREVRDLIL